MVTIFRKILNAAAEPHAGQHCGSGPAPIAASPAVAAPQPPSLPAAAVAPASAEDGARLIDEVAVAIRRHVMLPNNAAAMIALFVMHAHGHDAAQFSPILAIVSPEIGCGKTTLLRTVAALAPSPLPTANITTAGLYRTIGWRKHTLLIDEGDTFLLAKKDLLGILNSGHCREVARVVRYNGNFNVWCPKVIALIGELPPSLRDRSLPVALKRMRPHETVAPLDQPALAALERLRERVAIWTQQHLERSAGAPAMPKGITNRAADNWRHVLAIADVAGGRWPELARRLAAAARSEVTPATALLTDIRGVFAMATTDRIPTASLMAALVAKEDRQWAEWHRGRPITAQQLASILKPFEIFPRTMRFGTVLAKGYLLVDFDDAFTRYL